MTLSINDKLKTIGRLRACRVAAICPTIRLYAPADCSDLAWRDSRLKCTPRVCLVLGASSRRLVRREANPVVWSRRVCRPTRNSQAVRRQNLGFPMLYSSRPPGNAAMATMRRSISASATPTRYPSPRHSTFPNGRAESTLERRVRRDRVLLRSS